MGIDRSTTAVARLFATGDVRVVQEPAAVPRAARAWSMSRPSACAGPTCTGTTTAVSATPCWTRPWSSGTIRRRRRGWPARRPPRGRRSRDLLRSLYAQCLRGHQNLCPTVVFAGHDTCDGGLREVLAWPAGLARPRASTAPRGRCSAARRRGPRLRPRPRPPRRRRGRHRMRADRAAAHPGSASRRGAVDPRGRAPHAPACSRRARRRRHRARTPGAGGGSRARCRRRLRGRRHGRRCRRGHPRRPARRSRRARRIPSGNHPTFTASVARRKGLTLVLVRRINDVTPAPSRSSSRAVSIWTGSSRSAIRWHGSPMPSRRPPLERASR